MSQSKNRVSELVETMNARTERDYEELNHLVDTMKKSGYASPGYYLQVKRIAEHALSMLEMISIREAYANALTIICEEQAKHSTEQDDV